MLRYVGATRLTEFSVEVDLRRSVGWGGSTLGSFLLRQVVAADLVQDVAAVSFAACFGNVGTGLAPQNDVVWFYCGSTMVHQVQREMHHAVLYALQLVQLLCCCQTVQGPQALAAWLLEV